MPHTNTPPDGSDVAIIGAGIIGSATALELARRGLSVTVFERGEPGAEQSSRAWGFVRQQGRHPAELPLAAEANALWAEITAQRGATATGFQPAGILTPAETAEDEERVACAQQDAAGFGLRARILTPAELSARLPQLAGPWRSALLTEGDGYAEPALATGTIIALAREAGVRFRTKTPVLEVSLQAGQVEGVVTARGLHRARVVVLANGVGAASLGRRLGLAMPIQIVRSSVGRTVAAPVFTDLALWGPRVAYRPRPDGSFVIGNGYRGVGGDYDLTPNSFRQLRHFLPAYRRNWRLLRLTLGREFFDQLKAAGPEAPVEPPVNRGKIARNLAAFHRLFPHLGGVGLETAWAGRIDLTPDVIPIIDRPWADRGLYLAAGFSGHGFALGPSVGRQMAQWIATGRPGLDLHPFRLSRFTDGGAAHARHSL
ncbi:glycine/D-amino acid oxidase-like deaminating enzyme [Humitalea rosea]|uniref:Glycine/D-amino acid oxidase-like deaminating enzyme n=1 Tax=Humitalea rosea TaxID=990373 RepID=A0A2W7IIW3_9PROT|nr:FAD-binding oxidoreductase [Humitalea rosea]PZW46820.1 glycine/D-amino acid oxidase-like deaminating enzyme [Humitalea rosea]